MLVIFDCDGVLVDTEDMCAQVLYECLQPLGVQINAAEVCALFRGKSIAVCQQQVAALLADLEPYNCWPSAELDDFAAEFWGRVHTETRRAFSAGVEPIPGIKAVLEHLQARGIAFCVASNGQHEKMQQTLTSAGLAHFFPVHRFSATDVAAGKPAPDLFLYAARQMGVSPAQCVVVEDSPSGAIAARLAGMRLLGYCPVTGVGQRDASGERLLREQGAEVFSRMDELVQKL